ncbi:nuclear speckle splicing regulatory protein 1 [Euwallacea similis]|uniref:nuclear speckle splicing regulatory protein 1 n=1 Tax=Euwallacea similis TaxID=1736056 RepID=UPI0034507120
MAKQYGLILPNKKGGTTVIRPSIFNEDSESDTPTVSKPTGFNRSNESKKQDIINQQRALEEDPTVFQYDEVYDEIEKKKVESKLARKDIDKKPKYINRLLAAADRRKRENERRIERDVQKEREAEGEQFNDKESFVTGAYKRKLEEMKVLEEQEKREEYLEAIGDVSKQGNLDGFYRHLYDQKVNFEDRLLKEEPTEIKKELMSDKEGSEKGEKRSRESTNIQQMQKKSAAKRKYRSRKDSDNNEDEEGQEIEQIEIKKEHLPSNLDADSDFSVDSSDSESEKEEENKGEQENLGKDKMIEHEGEILKLPDKGNVLSDNAALLKKNEENPEEQAKQEELKKPKKPKVDIWKKHTVGEVFDEAVRRYFERKAARGW